MQSQFRQLEPPSSHAAAPSRGSRANESSGPVVAHRADENDGHDEELEQPLSTVVRAGDADDADDADDAEEMAPDWLDELFGSDDDADTDADALGDIRSHAGTVVEVQTRPTSALPHFTTRRESHPGPPASKRAKVEPNRADVILVDPDSDSSASDPFAFDAQQEVMQRSPAHGSDADVDVDAS